MLSRRSFLLAGCAACLPFAGIRNAQAHDPYLVADLLIGVSDALVRNYIRHHYDDGYWDGRYWWYDGHRYSPRQYRDVLIDGYWLYRDIRHYDRRPPPPRPAVHHRPPRPQHRPAPRVNHHRPHSDPRPPHRAEHRPPMPR